MERNFLQFSLGDVAIIITIIGVFLKQHAELVEIKLKVKTLWNRYIRDRSEVD